MPKAPNPLIDDGDRRGVLSAVARAVHRSRLRHPPPGPDRPAQLLALAAVVADAVGEQLTADRVVAACGDPGPVPGEVARTAARQAVQYLHIATRLRDLAADGDVALLRERALRLVLYHQWMLRQSANFAFTSHPDARTEQARLRINGLGAPGDRLRELYQEVRATAGRADRPEAGA
ncbi:hypothetical protein ACFVHB_07010 [Kitasatospora sp. NPDC127111]|uniref:hypothetical protein n=1 Tax=Kitasatospora sp. NPDC127111 TaxID=3345363 RepID=UPI00362B8B72